MPPLIAHRWVRVWAKWRRFRVLGPAGLLVALVYAIYFTSGYLPPIVVSLGLAYLVSNWALDLRWLSDKRLAAPEVVAMMDNPSVEPSFPAKVIYTYDRLELGEDVGVVTFCDGWLGFAGQRTEFSLRRSDVATADRIKNSPTTLLLTTSHRFPTLACLIEPYPLARIDGVIRQNLDGRLNMEFRQWCRLDEARSGQAVFPPNTYPPVDPWVDVRRKVFCCGWIVGTTVAGMSLPSEVTMAWLGFFLAIAITIRLVWNEGVAAWRRHLVHHGLPGYTRLLSFRMSDLSDHFGRYARGGE